jgi:hypothetical protein
MGSRRMISKKIVESTRFLRMPLTSQYLYMHLVLNADDDGIVEAYPVMRITKTNEDDLAVLIGRGFVFPIIEDEQIQFIEHWYEHNSIRADRKTNSIYLTVLQELKPELPYVMPRKRADRKKEKEKKNVEGVHGTSRGQPMDGISQDKIRKDKVRKENIRATGFSNFKQRDTDYDAIAQLLINQAMSEEESRDVCDS